MAKREIQYQHVPLRMRELWDWVVAFYAYDWGDPSALAFMIGFTREVPPECIDALAAVVAGERPRRRKSKLPRSLAMRYAAKLSDVLGTLDRYRHDITFADEEGKGLVAIASRRGEEPQDVSQWLANERATIMKQAADDLGVSVETVEELLRDMRDRIKRWPIV